MVLLPFEMTVTTGLIVVCCFVGFLAFLIDQKKKNNKLLASTMDRHHLMEHQNVKKEELVEPPGPKPWPIIGSLHILGQYDVPYKAFAELAKIYNSPIVKIKLGSLKCVVINGVDNIKEVLFNKGMHFDSRPNFVRYHRLFDGNKENSLAFCNWSDLQKSRREMLRAHAFPRAFTYKYNQLNVIIASEVEKLFAHLDKPLGPTKVVVKPLVLKTCANIFTSYFGSRRWDLEDKDFHKMVVNFDKVFYEVNQGYAADFMPFLMPFHAANLKKMSQWTHEIRAFVETHIIANRQTAWTSVIPEEDYVDCLVNHVNTKSEPQMSWETALFALEDIIGGHSAIGNFLMKVFGYLTTLKHVQETAQKEIDEQRICEATVGLEHRHSMPYTDAILLEAIRLISSPIVPHVANRDSSISGYKIEKDTFLFLDNYDLNMSEKYWSSPDEFMPERFIRDGRILKPEHYLPFGGGRRSCMGYKLVQNVGFSVLASILKNFNVVPITGEIYKVPIGNLALPEVTYNFRFERRY